MANSNAESSITQPGKLASRAAKRTARKKTPGKKTSKRSDTGGKRARLKQEAQTKAAFVIARPKLSVTEILGEAKREGVDVSASYAYSIRRRKAKDKKLPVLKKTSGGGNTKAGFVRSFPFEMPAKDVIARADASGIKLDRNYVHRTRSVDKANGAHYPTTDEFTASQAPTGAKGGSPVQSRAGTNEAASRTRKGREPVAASTSHADATFYATLKQIGVDRAKQLIARFEAALIS
jgi:hypothetical protein